MPKYKYVDGVKYRVVPQSVLGYALVREGSDNSLPTGGTDGQVLAKASNADYDVEWSTVESGADKVHVCVPTFNEETETIVLSETWSEIKSYLDNGYIVAVRYTSDNQTLMQYGSVIKYDSSSGIYSFTTIRYNGITVDMVTYTTDSADGHPSLID